MSLCLGSTVILTTDLPRAVAFWTTALGLRSRDAVAADTDFVVLVDPHTGEHRMSLRLGDVGERVEPVPVHLDLYADDQRGEVARLLDLGAARAARTYPHDPDFVVLEDPDGHLFRVVAGGA
jgi:catechol 2,3-dioxygenase-like lactoylglutathione lyase family enzyme